MKKLIFTLISVITTMTLLTNCELPEVTMPYGSKDYINGEWTVEQLTEHFKNLGFSEINITNVNSYHGDEEFGINRVSIEDTSSDSWFTEYRVFEQGEMLGTWLEIEIETFTLIPTHTMDNSPELQAIAVLDDGALDDSVNEQRNALNKFMAEHDGEYIEFDGTLTDWYDELFWVGVSFTVAVEDNEQLCFSWSTTDLIDLKMTGDYHYNKYHVGLITEGMRVHIRSKIVNSEDGWHLEIASMEII